MPSYKINYEAFFIIKMIKVHNVVRILFSAICAWSRFFYLRDVSTKFGSVYSISLKVSLLVYPVMILAIFTLSVWILVGHIWIITYKM